MIKWISAVILLVFVSLGCEDSSQEKTLVGTWEVIKAIDSRNAEKNMVNRKEGKTLVIFTEDSVSMVDPSGHKQTRKYSATEHRIWVENDLMGEYKIDYFDATRLMLKTMTKYEYVHEGRKPKTIEFTTSWKLRKIKD